jgi:glutaredoxin
MTGAQARSLAGLVLLVVAVSAAADWWRERQVAQLGAELAEWVQPGDIQLVSSTTCVFCDRARRWLNGHQLPFTECFIERDPDCAARYQALGAQGTPTLQVRGQTHLGFSAEWVRDRLRVAPPRSAPPGAVVQAPGA